MKKAIICLGMSVLIVGLVGCSSNNMSASDEAALKENMNRDLRPDEVNQIGESPEAEASAMEDAPTGLPAGKGPRGN
jgi:hypothetical protein